MAEAYIDYGSVPVDAEAFACGEPELDGFIRESAATFVEKGLCAITLLVDQDTHELLGYYTISPFSIYSSALGAEQSKHFNIKFPVPAWKIGMLAVAKKYQRNSSESAHKRYGSMLLQEAIHDIQQRAKGGAGALILVDAINRKVKKFYKKFGFVSIPNTSNQMVRPLAEQVDDVPELT